MSERKQNLMTISWFSDLAKRERLDLDPQYQRRSVWNQSFKDYFIDTILLKYPAPAIFLYEEMDTDGTAIYHVVDGKQRLMTILEFADNEFPISDSAEKISDRGKYFKDLDDETKRAFWSYQFSVEYLVTDDLGIINNVFDRINRNVKRLSPQELRHAQYDGNFITEAEDLAEWIQKLFPNDFPRLAAGSRRQMKDVELVAQLLLLIEQGPTGHTQAQLDEEFSKRDEVWTEEATVQERFQDIMKFLKAMIDDNPEFEKSRLRNQADFYSLVGAIDMLMTRDSLPNPDVSSAALLGFAEIVNDDVRRIDNDSANQYYKATRSASSDIGARKKRIEILMQKIAEQP